MSNPQAHYLRWGWGGQNQIPSCSPQQGPWQSLASWTFHKGQWSSGTSRTLAGTHQAFATIATATTPPLLLLPQVLPPPANFSEELCPHPSPLCPDPARASRPLPSNPAQAPRLLPSCFRPLLQAPTGRCPVLEWHCPSHTWLKHRIASVNADCWAGPGALPAFLPHPSLQLPPGR